MSPKATSQLLKQVLENLSNPQRLDSHPWVNSPIIQYSNSISPSTSNPGQKLADAVCHIFREMMPTSPPKKGKRLDTRWGKFGILAAQYFAPYMFGQQRPDSLRDSWMCIDKAIELFKFGENASSHSVEEINQYKLVSTESNIAPLSTLSDWHVNGIEQLTALIELRENQLLQSSVKLDANPNKTEGKLGISNRNIKEQRPFRKWIGAFAIIISAIGLLLAGWWGWQVYNDLLLVKSDLSQLQQLATGTVTLDKIKLANARLTIFRQDLLPLKSSVETPLRIIGPILIWVPVYGRDIYYSADLLEFADKFSESLQTTFQATGPFLEPGVVKYNPQLLTKLLVAAQPDLQKAKEQLTGAIAVRQGFKGVEFSSNIQSAFDKLDPILPQIENGLALGTVLPVILGADNNGPKTYMLLVQNEDELRPTGGFITSVGSFVIKNGNVFGLQFQEAGDLEDWTLPYPNAPWQLAQYMNSPVLVLRDANWFTDYPTAVNWIEYLYAYNHKNSVDGVFAVNQQALVELLQAIGPVSLDAVSTPITSDDVIQYMRASKVPPNPVPANFYRKAFISQIAEAVIKKVLAGDGINWQNVALAIEKSLREHNILLQFDDSQMTNILADYGWDGVVRPGNADFLMAVDTNVGFNKTNAVVDRKFNYDVDLTNLSKPTSTFVVSTSNHANSTASCIQWGDGQHPTEQAYPINYCYWNYLRVYVPSGSILESGTPHQVPADWMLQGVQIPARIDTIDESIPNVNEYGTMMVVPEGETFETSFNFNLPQIVVSEMPASHINTYQLKIQKQPGVISTPTTIRIHLPANAQGITASSGGQVFDQNVLFQLNLETDMTISVSFHVP